MAVMFIELNRKDNKVLFESERDVPLPRVGDSIELRSIYYDVERVEFNLLNEKVLAVVRVFCRREKA